ncbi:alkane hydroxylase MAH1-like [Mangifera indica]|uniref:alkane hydroxylase MAH1-like n=1 Tax=Mangifera indica TaxID=29780 RepID=UPI001CFB6BD8|nr:alkane hydroxylase MAH1-like [Mangifera indica]
MAIIGLFEIFLAFISFVVLRYCTHDWLPMNYPLVGMFPELLIKLHRIHEAATEVLQRSKGTFLFKGPWFSNMDILATVDPANIHYIMSSNFSNFPKGPDFKEIFDVLGDGIFNTDSDLWRSQRKAAQMLMNHQRFQKFLSKTSLEKLDKGLIPILEHVAKEEKIVDLQDLFQRFTFDLTFILVTGYDPQCLSIEFPEVPFARALEDAEESLIYRHAFPERIWKLQRWLGIGEEKKLKKAKETLDRIVFEYIKRKREELSDGVQAKEEEGVDLLTSYINEEYENVTLKLDDKLLRDTILSFMIAGRDTTSSGLTWFFWLLSKNPQAETKIREELKLITPMDKTSAKWWKFDIKKLNKLTYLHGALCETLRLYPPVPFQHKVPLEPDILPSGHRVTPKNKILFFLYAMGRMKSIWGEDCLEFKPERWISEKGLTKHEPSYKFLAFNAGPRTCLGKDVAFTKMKVAAAAIIHNYNVQVLEGQPHRPNLSIILQMKSGLKVRLVNRWPDQ